MEVFQVLRTHDRTGYPFKTPVYDRVFLIHDHAKKYVDSKPTLYGESSPWEGVWAIRTVKVYEEDITCHEYKQKKLVNSGLAKLTKEEISALGLNNRNKETMQEQHMPSPHADTLTSIEDWHREARPSPTVADFNVQLGCHFEEVCEMLESIHLNGVKGDKTTHYREIKLLSESLKNGNIKVTLTDRKGFIDSVADQIVTGVGAAYCIGMDAPLASIRVNLSNWSKFVDGKAVKQPNGKIDKSQWYKPPNLTGCY